MITKAGYFYMYEASRAALVYRQKITEELVVCSVRNQTTDGMICINKAGQVLAINVDENNLVPYVMNATHIPDSRNVAFKLAARFGLREPMKFSCSSLTWLWPLLITPRLHVLPRTPLALS